MKSNRPFSWKTFWHVSVAEAFCSSSFGCSFQMSPQGIICIHLSLSLTSSAYHSWIVSVVFLFSSCLAAPYSTSFVHSSAHVQTMSASLTLPPNRSAWAVPLPPMYSFFLASTDFHSSFLQSISPPLHILFHPLSTLTTDQNIIIHRDSCLTNLSTSPSPLQKRMGSESIIDVIPPPPLIHLSLLPHILPLSSCPHTYPAPPLHATPDFLTHHHSSSLGILSCIFSRSTKTQCNSFWSSLYFNIGSAHPPCCWKAVPCTATDDINKIF